MAFHVQILFAVFVLVTLKQISAVPNLIHLGHANITLTTCNSMLCELPGVKEVVTTESWQVLIEHVSQHVISRNQCELWFQSLTHVCKGCICSPRKELEVVLQQPQNKLLLLCYKGCTLLSASANQLTTETSLWAYPCYVDTIVHRQLGCSAYAAGGGLSASFYSR